MGRIFQAFSHDQTDADALVRNLGSVWRIESAAIKPYASCRGTHASIDAIGKLMRTPGITLENISEVHARMSPFLYGMCGGRDVSLMPAAQMSLPYAVAARMIFGDAGLSAYADERRNDPTVQKIMAKIVLSTDDDMAPNDEPYITVVLADGRRLEERVSVALGAPDNPLGDDALFAKFTELASMALSSARVDKLADMVLSLDRLGDCRSLPALLAPGAN